MARNWMATDVHLGLPIRIVPIVWNMLRKAEVPLHDIFQRPELGEALLTILLQSASNLPDDVRVIGWFQKPDQDVVVVWITHQSFELTPHTHTFKEFEAVFTDEVIGKWAVWANLKRDVFEAKAGT